jgi:putative membrane protein
MRGSTRKEELRFFSDPAKHRVAAAVKAIEAETSAEIVVAVRARSADERAIDHLFAFAVAMIALGGILFLPQPFALEAIPIDVLVVFGVATFAIRRLPAIRRRLIPSSRLEDAVRVRARAAFVDLGVSRTRGRTGVLVFVSMFERIVAVVPDIGVEGAHLPPSWGAVVEALESVLRPRPDLDRFLNVLDALRAPLHEALPRGADDVNELPDEPITG